MKRIIMLLITWCTYGHVLPVNAWVLSGTDQQSDSSTVYHQYTYMFKIYLSEEKVYTLDSSVDRKTSYTYVFDRGSGSPMMDSLLVNNLGYLPLEILKLDHDKIVDGKVFTYYASGKALRKEELDLQVPSKGFDIPFEYVITSNSGQTSPRGVIIDPRYKQAVTYDLYDSRSNLLQSTATDGITSSIVWGYNDRYPIAEISNAKISDVAYSSFEKRAKGNWQFTGSSVVDATSPMGEQCYNLSGGAITKTGLTTNKQYRLSYWQKQGATVTISGGSIVSTVNGRSLDGWTYVIKIVNVTGPVSVSGTGFIDELRLHPKEAIMMTTAYKPLFGVICKADASGRTVYYEYDGFQRIKYERDQNKNIIQSYTYHNKP